MENYFKSELKMLEFALLELDGKIRNKMLGVNTLYFRNTKVAKEKREIWESNIVDMLNEENNIELRNRCLEEFKGLLRLIRGY